LRNKNKEDQKIFKYFLVERYLLVGNNFRFKNEYSFIEVQQAYKLKTPQKLKN
jgi:hypothetical protein